MEFKELARRITEELQADDVVTLESEGFYLEVEREDVHNDNARFYHSDGRYFYVSPTWAGPGKLHISGMYPKDGTRCMSPRDWGAIKYSDTPPSINVSASRDPKAIAKDITRRFLPVYTEVFNACVARKTQQDSYRNTQAEAVRQIVAALGPKADARGSEDSPKAHFYNEGAGYGEFSPNSVELHSVPLAMLLEIAALVRKYSESVEG
jgi:hypothetical protein